MAAYSVAQVVIDIESGYYMLKGAYPVHRQAHTFLMGGLIGLACGLIVSRVGVWWARPRDLIPDALAAEYRLPIAVVSGIFGGVFHSVLDGIMHAELDRIRNADPYVQAGVAQYELLPWDTGIGREALDKL